LSSSCEFPSALAPTAGSPPAGRRRVGDEGGDGALRLGGDGGRGGALGLNGDPLNGDVGDDDGGEMAKLCSICRKAGGLSSVAR